MEYNKAYEVLGVREDASKDEIERKYTVLLKKKKIADAEGDTVVSEQIDFEAVTLAYNLLMGYEEPGTEEVLSKPNPILQKAGIDEKKAKNFWYYYKFYIFGGIALLLILIFSVRSCVTAEKPDFNLAIVGNIYYSDSDVLKNNIKKAVPEIKVPGIDGVVLSKDNKNEQAYAMQMKAVVLFAAADVDLFILDRESFQQYGKQGAFLSLDQYEEQLGVDTSKEKDYILKPQDETKEALYGIDISGSKLLKNSQLVGQSMVIAVPVRTKHIDMALKLAKVLMQQ